ncbi:PKD domain-containing protein [Pontibacter sp. G13]|uniref:PKD domain-containing protein n=1 Tax=Pontibacter sp. G13 TaxID=3074898 RepID=UPI00288A2767|nr:PKD domain-containing protein [Pontibacter sp. G13]WNJ19555.1 PKD domain-containing protein [Pontibacter sp. G13]
MNHVSIRWFLLCGIFFIFAKPNLLAQTSADFTSDKNTGCSPFSLVVKFSDLSTGNPTSWTWYFGDASNSTSTLQSPTFIYSDPGCYDVTLVISGPQGTDSITKTCFIEMNAPPSPGFVLDQTEGCAPLTVTFTDTTGTGGSPITDYTYVLSDGSISMDPNPTFTFSNAPDTISVAMTVVNADGCSNTVVFQDQIYVYEAADLDFSVDVNSACSPPLTVNFTNNTTLNGATSPTYTWNFPGGSTPGGTSSSIGANPPPITYGADGQYDVELIMESANGCLDTLAFDNMVGIGGVTADFTASQTTICLGDSITFTSLSTGGVSSLAWDFGEFPGVDGTDPVESYTYSTPGVYTVSLFANNTDCGDTLVRTSYILVQPVPTAGYTVDHAEDCQPGLPFNFTDISTGAVAWDWDFGDGATSNQQNPTHVYSAYGTFVICLTVENAQGCTDVFCDSVEIAPPNVAFTRDPEEGCAPLSVQFTDNSTAIDPIISWNWDFGTPTAVPPTASVQNPSVVFPNPGSYPVTLIVATATGCTDTLRIGGAVRVGEPPVNGFSADKDTVCINEDITFEADSFNDDWEYLFDFQYVAPGNFTPYDTNVVTTIYPDSGLYSVALIVSDNGCNDTMVVNNMVFSSPPKAEFGVSDSIFCSLPDTIQFQDQSVGPADVYEWYINGSLYSTQQNPPAFPIPGTGVYIIDQIIVNTLTDCSDTATSIVFAGNPQASFTPSVTSGCAPLTVNFSNTSLNSTSTSVWSLAYNKPVPGQFIFGDSPTFVYQDTGEYSVSLVAIDQFGCRDTVSFDSLIRVDGAFANFGSSLTTGCPGANIQFSDSSTTTSNNIVSWSWDFGDPASGANNTSTLQNPAHSFSSPGSYDIRLAVVDDNGCQDTLVLNDYVLITFPEPDFTIVDDTTCKGALVQFVDSSQGIGLSYLWDFGDGMGTDTMSNPTYAYTDTGSFDVQLVLTDINGCVDSITYTDAVYIEYFRANFGGDPTSGFCPPMSSQFTDSSEGNVVGWEWDFGDGFGFSFLQDPGYVYFAPGQYDVRLIATHEEGCKDTLIREDYINLSGPNGSYEILPGDVCLGDTVCITLITTSTAAGFLDWKDGSVDSLLGLTATNDTITICHLYADPGNFKPEILLLDAQMPPCPYTLPQTDSVMIFSHPTAQILPQDTAGCAPLLIPFMDASIPGDSSISAWFWDFGDGDTANATNPVHLYTGNSLYNVTLMVEDINGCRDTATTTVATYQGAIAEFEADITRSCAPEDITFTDLSSGETVIDWQWIFGDGDTVNGDPNPVHEYLADTLYSVTLLIEDSLGCRDTLTKVDYIDLRRPEPYIYADVTSGCNPVEIRFHADSSILDTTVATYEYCVTEIATGIVTCESFNGGKVFYDYEFLNPGIYEVTVTITNVLGCGEISEPFQVIIDERVIPDPVVMRNVTVLERRVAEVLWEPYLGTDFVEYHIYRKVSGGNAIQVGTITDQAVVTFIDSSAVGNLNLEANSFCYQVLVLNTCGETSDIDQTEEHCTINLETLPALDAILLEWTPYVGYTVAQYEIYELDSYDLTNPPQPIAIVPGNTLSYLDEETFCREEKSYRIKAVASGGAIDQVSWGDLDAERPDHLEPTTPTDVLVATVTDSVIDISWDNYEGYLPDFYYLERSRNGLDWNLIDEFDLSIQSYTDTDVDVDNQSYYYRVFTVDQCEDVSVPGYIGKTILLQATRGISTQYPTLQWTPYLEWQNGVFQYRIEIFNDALGAWEEVGVVDGTLNFYEDRFTTLDQPVYEYRVIAIELGGNQLESYSNVSTVVFGPQVFAPNAFTPNGDLQNDRFRVFGRNLNTMELQIFNRWGEMIFRTLDPSSDQGGWDGTRDGVPVQEGVYVYRVNGVGEDGTPVELTGSVTLIR